MLLEIDLRPCPPKWNHSSVHRCFVENLHKLCPIIESDKRLVPGLKNMPVPVLVTLKIRYTNRKAPAQRPFLLAGELASPAGRVLVVLG